MGLGMAHSKKALKELALSIYKRTSPSPAFRVPKGFIYMGGGDVEWLTIGHMPDILDLK